MAAAVLAWRAARVEQSAQRLAAVCVNCGGGGGGVGCGFDGGGGAGVGGGGVECVSLDCPVYFERRKVDFEVESAQSHFTAAASGSGGLSW